ncbi:hypothetical protein BST92_08620 [Nonlabens arenilitoris]|uniref:TonB-dependent receptor n=1 Tax=Nonlabens arenilitoris TaxID=1217969 RepID=A0A2S7UCK7_9FLAO|nr:hypothetical protein [Nonlabens arenilitoris]PQJ31982.1 hypothetical protein BST92_08620 [Nonlabens arenilitoris]
MKLYQSYISVVIALIAFSNAQAQVEEESELNGGTITVVKPYDPTISDAFKVKSTPSVNDTTKVKKKPVTYSIFSVPVASTFTPAKGKLSRRKAPKRAKFFDNYARLGVGNYVNILGEFAGNFEIDRDSDVGVFFNHNSSQGGIDDIAFDDDFSDTSLDISYGKRNRDSNWGITAGGRYQTANWYGVAPVALSSVPTGIEVDAGTSYLTIGLSGKAQFFDSVLEKVEVGLSNISSGNDGSETRVRLQPQLAFEVLEEEIALGVEVDYLTGSFDTQGSLPAPDAYSYLNIGANPSINLYGDKYKVELGARLNYITDSENSESNFYVYPDINASYILMEEKVIAYTVIGGGLDMNTLQNFADENVFIAPAITVAPTNRQVDAQLGIKGKLSSNFGYKLYGGYSLEENRYFYTKDNNAIFTGIGVERPSYNYANTFATQYGDLNTLTFGGSASVDLNTQFNLTLNTQFMSYDVTNGDDFDNVASQLPTFTADIVGNYDINDKWNIGTTLYFVGERDVFRIGNTTATETLDSFIDLNLDINYKINPKLTAFLRGHNLTGGNYQYYLDYPVQNLQILGGAVYKFDF